jgi:hypothetical protein
VFGGVAIHVLLLQKYDDPRDPVDFASNIYIRVFPLSRKRSDTPGYLGC